MGIGHKCSQYSNPNPTDDFAIHEIRLIRCVLRMPAFTLAQPWLRKYASLQTKRQSLNRAVESDPVTNSQLKFRRKIVPACRNDLEIRKKLHTRKNTYPIPMLVSKG
jgi:hypothetical protein